MERRILGRTSEQLSIIGFGGVVVMNETAAHASACVDEAIGRGINYFDVSPSYGNAEERLGPALRPYRKSVFLACKTLLRTANESALELRTSLQRLCTDHVDLYQFHGVNTIQTAEQLMSPTGALNAVVEAKKAGLLRYIGFSSHSEEVSLFLMDRFPFDTIFFPINYSCWQQSNFGPKVVEKALQNGVGILALKALALRNWAPSEKRIWPKCWYKPIENLDDAKTALRFTLSLPITAAISSGHMELLRLACDAAEHFSPLSPEELQQRIAIEDSHPIFPK